MMFDQTGQSVVLVTMPGYQTTALSAPQPPQLHAQQQPTIYLPYNLVLKQEQVDHHGVLVQRPEAGVGVHNPFLLPTANGYGVVVKEENGSEGILPDHHEALICTAPIKQEMGPEAIAPGVQRPLPCAPILISSDEDSLPAVLMPIGEVKQESQSEPVLSSISTQPQPLLITPSPLGQVAMVTSVDTGQQSLADMKSEYLKSSPTQSPVHTPPLGVAPSVEVAPSVNPSSPCEPDMTALTTLAIVCDNIGNERDSQYVVKVQLEEPVTSPPSSPKTLQDNFSINPNPTRQKRLRSPTKTSLAKKAQKVAARKGRSNSKTKDLKVKRSQRLKHKRDEVALHEISDESSIELVPNPCSPVQESRVTKKTAKKTKTQAERRTKGEASSKKRNRKQPLTVDIVTLEESLHWPDPDNCPADFTTLELPNDNNLKVENVGELSPASTLPYGEDSNDSIDLTGRSMFSCTQCSKSYASDRRLRLHIGLLHQESDKSPLSAIFSCSQCTKAYTSQKRLDLHVLLVHHDPSTPDVDSPQRQKLLSDNTRGSIRKRKKRKRSLSGGESQSCDISQDKYLEGTNLTVEDFWAAVSDTAPFSCIVCDKQYTSRNRLGLHLDLCHTRQSKMRYRQKRFGTSLVSGISKQKHKRVPHSVSSVKDSLGDSPLRLKDETDSDSVAENAVSYLEDVLIKQEPDDQESTEEQEPKVKVKRRPRYNCPGCGLIFMSLELYQLHLPVHDGKKPLFNDKKKRNRRVVIEKYYMTASNTPDRPYCCRICERDFAERRILTTHINNVHEIYDSADKIFCCPHCDKQFIKSTYLQRHLYVHGREELPKEFKCPKCSKTFSQKVHLKRHQRLTHTDISLLRVFTCDLCKKSFKLKAHLLRHMKMHQGFLPFKCKECSFTGADRQALGNHLRVHTGERPFKCPYCTHCIAIKSNVRTHILNKHPEKVSEAERREHQCKVCGRVMCKGNLKVHVRRCKKAPLHQCEECGEMFARDVHLREHLTAVHQGVLPYQCAKCMKQFQNKRQLKRHHSEEH